MSENKLKPEELAKLSENLGESDELDETDEIETNPIASIARSLFMIERHLQALAYQGHTDRVEGLGYSAQSFYQIYEAGLGGNDVGDNES